MHDQRYSMFHVYLFGPVFKFNCFNNKNKSSFLASLSLNSWKLIIKNLWTKQKALEAKVKKRAAQRKSCKKLDYS